MTAVDEEELDHAELGVVEQRYQAVLEVLGGATVSDVAWSSAPSG